MGVVFRLLLPWVVVLNVSAQEWPAKPVRIIATGTIGAVAVFRAEPDGYTLMSSPPAPLVINPSLYRKLPYDPQQFVPVSVMAAIPSVMLVHPKTGASSVADFVSLARHNPGKLNYASQGTSSVSFLTTELFMAAAGGADGKLTIAHVPYKGTAPGLAALPEVLAMAEIYPGFVSVAWFGVVAPPKTPAAIAAKLHEGISEALKMTDVQKRLAELSAEPIGMGPAEMAIFMREEAARWRDAIRTVGLKSGEL